MLLMKHIRLPQKIIASTIAALAILSFGIIAPAKGQNTYEGMETQEIVHVPDTKLQLFIKAQEAVNNVQDQYQKAAQNPSGETADGLQRSMGEEIIRTIEAHGLTIDEYNTILMEIQKAESNRANQYDMTPTE